MIKLLLLFIVFALGMSFDTFVLKSLRMKYFPKYFIPFYIGVASFDIRQIGKQLLKLKKSNITLYNEILDKVKDKYNFSVDEKELEKLEQNS